jgi:hypothetical protein
MIVLKTIHNAGGACPYQLEATTDDGKWFYLRYRGGMLRYAIAPSSTSWMKRKGDSVYDFSKKIGDDFDGVANHETIYPHLKDLVKFPEDFKISSEEIVDPTDLK